MSRDVPEHRGACATPSLSATDTGKDAAALQARAACLHAALQTRTVGEQPEQIMARAETYWAWVSQPAPAPADKPARRPR